MSAPSGPSGVRGRDSPALTSPPRAISPLYPAQPSSHVEQGVTAPDPLAHCGSESDLPPASLPRRQWEGDHRRTPNPSLPAPAARGRAQSGEDHWSSSRLPSPSGFRSNPAFLSVPRRHRSAQAKAAATRSPRGQAAPSLWLLPARLPLPPTATSRALPDQVTRLGVVSARPVNS